MTRQQVEELFARRDAAVSQYDVVGVSALNSDDVVVSSPMAGGTVHGRAAVEEVNRAYFAGFPDVTFTREALVIDGDRAVWIGEVRGTDTGGFMGLAATGKPFRLPMVMVCTLKDGAIIREQRIYDFTGMLIQIGVLKAKPI
jgi:predicted ester cyclase